MCRALKHISYAHHRPVRPVIRSYITHFYIYFSYKCECYTPFAQYSSYRSLFGFCISHSWANIVESAGVCHTLLCPTLILLVPRKTRVFHSNVLHTPRCARKCFALPLGASHLGNISVRSTLILPWSVFHLPLSLHSLRSFRYLFLSCVSHSRSSYLVPRYSSLHLLDTFVFPLPLSFISRSSKLRSVPGGWPRTNLVAH